jgi:adenylate cyclase
VGVSRYYRRFVVLAGVLTAALVLALAALGLLHSIDLSSIDTRFAIRGSDGPPRGVVVVGIDSATFNYLDNHDPTAAHFPFARRIDARVIANLSRDGAKVIAYDEQFTEPTDPRDDNALILAARAAGNVVMATTEVAAGGKTRIFGGGPGLVFSRAAPADGQFPLDSDGRIRRMRSQILGLTTFPLATADRALGHRVHFLGGRRGSAYIDFRGPAGTVSSVPYWRVLEGRFAPGTFSGKVVVVGATESVLQDIHSTATDVHMPGPEVQANAIDTALRGFPLRPAPGWVNVALVIVLGLAAPLLALRLPVTIAIGLTAVAVAVLAVACQLTFDAGTIVGFVYPCLAAALSAAATMALRGARAVFERELVREVFARFVPQSVVSEVLAQASHTGRGGLRLGGVRREATVMFSDLRGFTSFAEGREPDETIEILNRYLTAMSDAILEHGGTLVSYQGDGIMAVFGAPVAQFDHADRALRAARTMIERLEEFNGWLRSSSHADGFKMGIGLNSGPVMSGTVGSQRRLEYTAIGDTTNTASRIEGLTKGTPHQLYIAGSTYSQLTDSPGDLVRVGELEIRGRVGRVTIFTLAGASDAVSLRPADRPGAAAGPADQAA